MANNSEEPSTAPEPGQWYNIKLGPSFKDNHHQQSHHSPKFCTLRYEFKPASIDSSQPGLLHKSKDNRVTVEYQNNQHGKPKVIFEGVGEDYRDNDAVLFFDGETFRLERLHRAVKRLRHVRLRGESAAIAASTMTTSVVPVAESYSTPVGKGSKLQPSNTGTVHEAQVQVEQTDIENSASLGAEGKSENDVEFSPPLPNPSTSSPEPKNLDPEENVDIIDDNDDACEAVRGITSEKESRTRLNIDINLPHQMDMDDEIADVDVSDYDTNKGPNAAEALRAQVNAEGREHTSSSSSSSDSESTGTESGSGSGSESGSVSTSTDSESSDGDSVNSI